MYGNIVTIHAIAMSAALVLMVLGELLFIPARLGRVNPARFALVANRIVGPLIAVGIFTGIALVILGGWSLLTPWLLCSFGLIVLLITVESIFVRPWITKVRRLPEVGGSDVGVRAILTDNRALLGRLTMIILFSLVVLMMRIKPELNWPF